MSIERLKIGRNPPDEVYVVIEVPLNSEPVKYEFDKESGMIFVDRFMQSSMHYPCNYGFIPHTLSGDGDPVDVLVHTNYPLISSAVVAVRPIGVLLTEDENGMDEKILAVPTNKVDLSFKNVKSYKDMPEIFMRKVEHFFKHYKDLEDGKWVKINGWGDAETAKRIITEAIYRRQ